MTKAAYLTIGIAAFVMFVIVYFIGCLPMFLILHKLLGIKYHWLQTLEGVAASVIIYKSSISLKA